MNCDCVKRVEGELATTPFITERAGEDIRVECMATAIQITKDLNLRSVINIPFRVRGTGKGFSSAKGKEFPVVASFCPFCGVSTKATDPTSQPSLDEVTGAGKGEGDA